MLLLVTRSILEVLSPLILVKGGPGVVGTVIIVIGVVFVVFVILTNRKEK